MQLSQEWLDVTPADVYYNLTGIRMAEVDLRTKAYRIEYKRKKQLSFEISMVILNRFKPFAVPHKSLTLNKDLTHIPSVSLLCKHNFLFSNLCQGVSILMRPTFCHAYFVFIITLSAVSSLFSSLQSKASYLTLLKLQCRYTFLKLS